MADLRHDVRASAIEWKRYKDQTHKWKHGSRPSRNRNAVNGKERPDKVYPRPHHLPRNTSKGVPTPSTHSLVHMPSSALSSHFSRVSSRHFAKLEALDKTMPRGTHSRYDTSSEALVWEERALAGMIPTIAPDLWVKESEMAEVMYSFDAESSPASSLGLESLVDRAEGAWKAKEVERVLRTEYDVVDSDGDSLRVGKGGKLSASFNMPMKEEEDVDGDWETVSL